MRKPASAVSLPASNSNGANPPGKPVCSGPSPGSAPGGGGQATATPAAGTGASGLGGEDGESHRPGAPSSSPASASLRSGTAQPAGATLVTRSRRARPWGVVQSIDWPTDSPSRALPTGAKTDTLPAPASASLGN